MRYLNPSDIRQALSYEEMRAGAPWQTGRP